MLLGTFTSEDCGWCYQNGCCPNKRNIIAWNRFIYVFSCISWNPFLWKKRQNWQEKAVWIAPAEAMLMADTGLMLKHRSPYFFHNILPLFFPLGSCYWSSSLSCLSHPVTDSFCACKITVHLLQEADNERMVVNRKLEAFTMCQHCCSTCWIAQVNVFRSESDEKTCIGQGKVVWCGNGQERRRARAKPEICMDKGFKLHRNQQNKRFESFSKSFPKSWLETNFFCCWCWKSDSSCPEWASKLFKARSPVCHSCRGLLGAEEKEREFSSLQRLNGIAGVHDCLTLWLEEERGNTWGKWPVSLQHFHSSFLPANIRFPLYQHSVFFKPYFLPQVRNDKLKLFLTVYGL